MNKLLASALLSLLAVGCVESASFETWILHIEPKADNRCGFHDPTFRVFSDGEDVTVTSGSRETTLRYLANGYSISVSDPPRTLELAIARQSRPSGWPDGLFGMATIVGRNCGGTFDVLGTVIEDTEDTCELGTCPGVQWLAD